MEQELAQPQSVRPQSAQQNLAQQSVAANPTVYHQTSRDQFAIEKPDGIANVNPEPSPEATDTPASVNEAQSSPPESSIVERDQHSTPTIVARASAENRAVALALVPSPSSAATSTTINAGATATPQVRLAIAGVRPGQGPVRVAIFTDASSFPIPTRASATFSLSADKSTVESEVAVVGIFAVGVYQDINGDSELNRNRFGIPLEPFAFSNNAIGQRGPPKFVDAAIVLPTKTTDGPTLVPIQLP